MAETPFPNPLTSQFNPSAWEDNTPLTEDELTYLDNNFVTYPTAQPNVTFPVSPTVPTLAIATNDTRAASAQFVQNAKNTQTWGALQTFNAGMVTNAIDPLTAGGTLLIGHAAATNNVEVAAVASRSAVLHLGDGNNSTGAVHIGNGTSSSNNVQILNGTGSTGIINLGSATSTTQLNCPLTPNYSYAASGSTGVDKLGETITGTNAGSLTFTANVAKTVSTISSLPVGVWLFSTQIARGSASGYLNCCISLTTDSFAAPLVADCYQTTGSTGPLNTFSFILYVPTTGVPYYFVGQADTGSPFASVIFKALRLF